MNLAKYIIKVLESRHMGIHFRLGTQKVLLNFVVNKNISFLVEFLVIFFPFICDYSIVGFISKMRYLEC